MSSCRATNAKPSTGFTNYFCPKHAKQYTPAKREALAKKWQTELKK